MNEFAIGAQPVAGGFVAWFRKVHKCDNEILKGKGGHPIIYPTKAEAKAAAGEAMVAYINGSITASGELAGGSVKQAKFAAAERKLFRQGKAFEVRERA